jgi:hypothetical protein
MNTDNTIPAIEEQQPPEQEASHTPEVSPIAAGGTIQTRNQFKKSDDPKIIQFSARATKGQAERIAEALEVRELVTGKKHDIVAGFMATLDYIEADALQSFKTKKKR